LTDSIDNGLKSELIIKIFIWVFIFIGVYLTRYISVYHRIVVGCYLTHSSLRSHLKCSLLANCTKPKCFAFLKFFLELLGFKVLVKKILGIFYYKKIFCLQTNYWKSNYMVPLHSMGYIIVFIEQQCIGSTCMRPILNFMSQIWCLSRCYTWNNITRAEEDVSIIHFHYIGKILRKFGQFNCTPIRTPYNPSFCLGKE